MSEEPKKKADIYQHDPLPYVVALRIGLDEDAPTSDYEWRGYAYSIFEAMMQATIGATGDANGSVRIVSILPDIAEFYRHAARKAATCT